MKDNAATINRHYGKPVPKTFDAVCIGGHYKDPRVISIWIRNLLTASGIAAVIAIPILIII